MAFSFDSPSLPGALALLAVGIWSWRAARDLRARLRVQLRFAAVLLAAFAVSLLMPAPGLAFNVMLLSASVASAALALAFSFRQPTPAWLSAIVLVIAFATSLFASLAAEPFLAFIFVGGAAAHILAASLWRMKQAIVAGIAAMLGAVSLALGGLTMMGGGPDAAALFFASALGLVARALETPIEHANPRTELPIG